MASVLRGVAIEADEAEVLGFRVLRGGQKWKGGVKSG